MTDWLGATMKVFPIKQIQIAEITIYENANFQGRSRSFGVGNYRLFDVNDMNDLTSSIRVPDGLVAYVYEHADSGGGYGISADFLEDCPDLAPLGLDNAISYISVFGSTSTTTVRDHRQNPPVVTTEPVVWVRGSRASGQYIPGHWESPRAGGQPSNHVVAVSPPLPPNVPPELPHLLDISNVNGSPWANPAFDTSDPSWSSNVVGGQTFDGTSAHKFEWVSVLNPGDEQDDEVGLAGTAVGPELSGADLPFTHPFGPDFEFTIVPDPEYDGLLAPANKDPLGVYGGNWTVAEPAGISIPTGVLGLEVDAALVPPDYRPAQGDRVAVYGRWIVDAGHPEFHTEIHPPLLMARARSVDRNGNPTERGESATTLFQLWSRPYQAGQLFSTNGHTGLALRDYLENIAFTIHDIRAFPPIFAKPFQGVHVVSFTIRPPIPPAPTSPVAPLLHLQCSYHFTVNGSCSVEVIPSPADPNSVLVIVRLDSAMYPALPEPPSQFDTFSIKALLAQVPGGDISKAYKMLLDVLAVIQDVHVRRFAAPQIPQEQGSVDVVPFTALNVLPKSSQTTDNNQPFPVYGWVKLQWVSAAISTDPIRLETGIQFHGPAV